MTDKALVYPTTDKHISKRFSLKNTYFAYFILYLFYYLSWAIFSALISVYLIGKGFQASEVSFTVSASFLGSMLFQPWMGGVASKIGMKKSTFLFMSVAAFGGIFFLFSRSFWMITIFYTLVMTAINGTNPMMEKICTASPFSYGKIRIWGTVGYAAGTQLSGWLYTHISPSSIFIAFLISVVICLFGTILCEPKESIRKNNPKTNEAGGKEKSSGFDSLFRNRQFAFYLILAALFYGVNASSNTFIPAFLTDSGLDPSLTGTILSLAVISELPLILFSGKFMDRLTSKTLLWISFLLTALMVAACAFGFSQWLMLPIILLCKHPSSMLFIMLNLKVVSSLVKEEEVIQALALVSTVRYLISMIFNSVVGVLIDLSGYSTSFLLLFLCMVAALIINGLIQFPGGCEQKLFS